MRASLRTLVPLDGLGRVPAQCPLGPHTSRRLAAGDHSVTFKCDPAKSDACPPSGLLEWSCSADCPNEECDVDLSGSGLLGTIPEIGSLRCAHRIARL